MFGAFHGDFVVFESKYIFNYFLRQRIILFSSDKIISEILDYF